MNKKVLFRLLTFFLIFFISVSFSQRLELGALQPFGIYARSGTITNSVTSSGGTRTNTAIISCFSSIKRHSTNKREFSLII